MFVSENGETYRYLINNANFYSYVKVVKIDSTTGKTIPCSGIGFHIYDPSGNQIQMTFTYPTVTTIDTFYTDGDGMLITPEKLEYGWSTERAIRWSRYRLLMDMCSTAILCILTSPRITPPRKTP